ncbi:hypothetical protein LTR84_011343 [Exophiala bonariae]|uniref:F-box domain-containing protein n=1 Tax=Exophiala bonariae TaxID=1690606 RepID=A0AAV9MV15_9EURO|nr:hypothetical protein LTR84_011343 [Exophiala bonariae]
MNIDQGYEGDDESDGEPRKKKPRTIGTHTPKSSDASDHVGTVNKADENGICNARKLKVDFLDLPAEIRKKLYDIWWDESPKDFSKTGWNMCRRCTKIINSNYGGESARWKEMPCPCIPKEVYPLSLRLVCKQLWRESTPYFLRFQRASVLRINFQDNFEDGEAPLDHGRVRSDCYVETEWTLGGCRKEQQGSYDDDFAVTWHPEKWFTMAGPITPRKPLLKGDESDLLPADSPVITKDALSVLAWGTQLMSRLKSMPLKEKEALLNFYHRCTVAAADSNNVEIVSDPQVNDDEGEEEDSDTQSDSYSDSDGDFVGSNLGLTRSKSRGRKAGKEDEISDGIRPCCTCICWRTGVQLHSSLLAKACQTTIRHRIQANMPAS